MGSAILEGRDYIFKSETRDNCNSFSVVRMDNFSNFFDGYQPMALQKRGDNCYVSILGLFAIQLLAAVSSSRSGSISYSGGKILEDFKKKDREIFNSNIAIPQCCTAEQAA